MSPLRLMHHLFHSGERITNEINNSKQLTNVIICAHISKEL